MLYDSPQRHRTSQQFGSFADGPPSRLAVRAVPDFLHQLYGAFRARLDSTFENFGTPGVVSQHGQHVPQRGSEMVPGKSHTERPYFRTQF